MTPSDDVPFLTRESLTERSAQHQLISFRQACTSSEEARSQLGRMAVAGGVGGGAPAAGPP